MFIALVGEFASHGDHGSVVGASNQTFVTINGTPVVVGGSMIIPHMIGPCEQSRTISTQSFITINGMAVNKIGDPTSCGAVLAPNPTTNKSLQTFIRIL